MPARVTKDREETPAVLVTQPGSAQGTPVQDLIRRSFLMENYRFIPAATAVSERSLDAAECR